MWVKFDDRFWRRPCWAGVPLDIKQVYSEAVSYCAEFLTDGWLPREVLRQLVGAEACRRALAVLQRRELVEVKDDRIRLATWNEHVFSKAEVFKRKAADRQRKLPFDGSRHSDRNPDGRRSDSDRIPRPRPGPGSISEEISVAVVSPKRARGVA